MTVGLLTPLAGVEIGHVAEAGAKKVLAELQAAGLLGEGKVHVISVCAIRKALGVRWIQRRSMVWDFVEGQIAKRIGDLDFSTRLDDETFLIVTPGISAPTARIVTVGILRDSLSHFLGESSIDDLVVTVATSFTDGQLQCCPLRAAEITGALEERVEEEAIPSGSANVSSPISAAPEEDIQLVAFDGRPLRFSSSVDPIIDLRHWAVAGHRIEPKIMYEDTRALLSSAERLRLLPRDVLAMDISTVRRGLCRLRAGESKTTKPSLILTVSFLTLSNSNSRATLLAAAAPARDLMLGSVIWEITDFESGVPADRVKETATLLMLFGRSVFSRVDTASLPTYSAKSAGLSGFVMSTPSTLATEKDVAVWLLALGRRASGKSPTLIAASLPSKDLLPISSEAGFTHATVRSLAPV